MASIIDNRNKTMLDSLKNSLKQAESVDILTAFFYFSGFNALAEELKDKKIRILVGNTIDPSAIADLCNAVKDSPDELLETYAVRGYTRLNNSQKKNYYVDSFVELFNKSALADEFDSTDSQAIFKMFLDKIADGTLEIRLTATPNHAKAYILTNMFEYSCFGDQKGVVFTGSSNFTYNGLRGQGEMNERFSDNSKYEEYSESFEKLWNDSKSIDVCVKDGNQDFINELKKKLWIFAKPTPYQIFIRILFELYASLESNVVKSPYEITDGKFSNLKYQLDAIKYGVDCINKNNGVIIADVVGLGKSVIASAIAHNLDMKRTVIIAPPHLVDQWNDYQQDFGLRGVIVCSSGKIEELYNTYAADPNPILYIIDEAHRYRNELSDAFEFYEVPQAATQTQNELSAYRLDFEESPRHESQEASDGQFVSAENTEINNRDNETNNTETNIENEEAVIIQKPRVREITIKPPTAEGRSRPKPITQVKQGEFEF